MMTREKIFFLLFGLAVFFIQPVKKGFELDGHLGWVASHVASVIIKATPENNFVGYSLHLIDNNQEEQLLYFDRYPLFFSALTRAILSPLEDKMDWWIFSARQLMNIIFLLSAYYAFRILTHFPSLSSNQRLATVGLCFSSYYFLEYKSMIHFDQPAILGMLALSDSIFHFKNQEEKKPLLFWAIVAPLLGRGYSSLFLMAGWLLLEFKEKVKLNKWRSFFISFPLMITIASTVICSSFLFFNVYSEAKLRNVEIREVGIVQSAYRRLGIQESIIKKDEAVHHASWPLFLNRQLSRLVKHINPYATNYFRPSRTIFAIVTFFYFLYSLRFMKSLFLPQERWMWTILLISGPLWTFTMKNLTAFHDYTMMYYFGFSLFFFAVILKKIGEKKLVTFAVCALILSSFVIQYIDQKKDLALENKISFEVEQIKELVAPGDKIFFPEHHRNILSGRPYSMGFYFFDNIISTELNAADWQIRRAKNQQGEVVYKGSVFELLPVKN